ncbi:coproporphyrinogen dehydrogenase HemZ [Anaerofustis stercorihominis]|uniref:Coproporphyrinogen dehydrogenase HemZ n=1 Tax=Anaerofustis stercorihominis TaxID=214853 RepID=A0A3E3DWQ5_9FIRM|nr:coproporphyrinogen dehydrogenase HemZ [Anaerofustis stercorihominis]RGD73516.1 coproporphyrinogen dehydrogenase HemZ [Anaerofustis stercorihominis]
MNIKTDENIKEIHVREILQLFYPDKYKDIKMKLYSQGNFVYLEYKDKTYKEKINISLKNATKKVVYKALRNETQKKFPYGILTGVKPINILDLYKDKSKNEIRKILKYDYLMSKDKIELLMNTKETQKELIDDNKYSLYIHIPFCPARCTYCSFPSKICNSNDLILNEYTNVLLKEVNMIAEIIDKNSINIDSIYIGGGTPGILNEELTHKLTNSILKNIIKDKNIEFTFELGRADMLTKEKLDILNNDKVNRICLNPQSMSKDVLDNFNRNISPVEFYKAADLIKQYNFILNSDLIMGLDSDSISDFINELKTLIDLKADNITIHTLSLKRSSDMDNIKYEDKDFYDVQNKCFSLLKSNGYYPYYLYKQKQSLCMGENVGFSKRGKECIYNIKTMKNKSTILALGAGGAGKVYDKKNDKTYRVDTTKDTNIYIKDFDKIIKRKAEEYNKYLNI